jgi:hypothetical protein
MKTLTSFSVGFLLGLATLVAYAQDPELDVDMVGPLTGDDIIDETPPLDGICPPCPPCITAPPAPDRNVIQKALEAIEAAEAASEEYEMQIKE